MRRKLAFLSFRMKKVHRCRIILVDQNQIKETIYEHLYYITKTKKINILIFLNMNLLSIASFNSMLSIRGLNVILAKLNSLSPWLLLLVLLFLMFILLSRMPLLPLKILISMNILSSLLWLLLKKDLKSTKFLTILSVILPRILSIWLWMK